VGGYECARPCPVIGLRQCAIPEWVQIREDLGSAELRHQSIAIGQWCLKIYDILDGGTFFEMISYDWEVIPLIMS
jgi:hypothetical protein